MVLIAGVAAAAAAAMRWWKAVGATADAQATVNSIRQQAGVLAALVNMLNALLDALMMVRRVNPAAAGGLTPAAFMQQSV